MSGTTRSWKNATKLSNKLKRSSTGKSRRWTRRWRNDRTSNLSTLLKMPRRQPQESQTLRAQDKLSIISQKLKEGRIPDEVPHLNNSREFRHQGLQIYYTQRPWTIWSLESKELQAQRIGILLEWTSLRYTLSLHSTHSVQRQKISFKLIRRCKLQHTQSQRTPR